MQHTISNTIEYSDQVKIAIKKYENYHSIVAITEKNDLMHTLNLEQ